MFFRSAFSRIWTKYRDLLSKSPYSVRKWENMDQKNSEQGHFLGSAIQPLQANIPCLYPLKTSENVWFYNVFRM